MNETAIAMDETRFAHLCGLVQSKGMEISFRDFTCSEIRWLIDETPFSPTDRKVAVLRFVENRTYDDISGRMEWYSNTTTIKHCRFVSEALKRTCFKVFTCRSC